MWRLAIRKDEEELIKMCQALNQEDPGPKPVPKEHIEKTLEAFRLDPVRGRAVILDIDGKVAGYALLISFWSNELGGEVCNIDELYVKPNFRRKGYSRAPIDALTKKNSIWPNRSAAIDLEVTPQNNKARALYTKLGFESIKNSHMRLSF